MCRLCALCCLACADLNVRLHESFELFAVLVECVVCGARGQSPDEQLARVDFQRAPILAADIRRLCRRQGSRELGGGLGRSLHTRGSTGIATERRLTVLLLAILGLLVLLLLWLLAVRLRGCHCSWLLCAWCSLRPLCLRR